MKTPCPEPGGCDNSNDELCACETETLNPLGLVERALALGPPGASLGSIPGCALQRRCPGARASRNCLGLRVVSGVVAGRWLGCRVGPGVRLSALVVEAGPRRA